MFVVVMKTGEFGQFSKRRFADKKQALAVMFGLRSAHQKAWLEYEPTHSEQMEAHDRELLKKFSKWVSSKEYIPTQLEFENGVLADEFMGVREEWL